MAKIKINVTQVMTSAGQGSTVQRSVSSVANDINNIKNRIDSRILNRNSISSRLNNVKNEVSDIHGDIVAICTAISTGAMNYNTTENNIVKNVNRMKDLNQYNSSITHNWLESHFKDVDNKEIIDEKAATSQNAYEADSKEIEEIERILQFLGIEYSGRDGSIFGDTKLTEFLAKYTVGNAEHYFGSIEYKIEDSFGSSIPLFEDFFEGLEDKMKDKGLNKDLKELKEYTDFDGNKIDTKDAPKFYERDITIAEIKSEASVSESLYTGNFDWGDWGKAGVTVGQAEAHAELSAGFYVLDADGDKKFSPGVKAEIGTSITAFEGQWENQWLGNDMLGLNTEVNATVGKAEAAANTTVQLFGDNGELDVQIGASASAEAIAGEIEGSIGVNVLGGEVGVKGGVNFGIGAHADVGIRDGVIKLDVGASLGVGLSLDVEVDVGGMVNTVVDSAQSWWDGIESGWNNLFG